MFHVVHGRLFRVKQRMFAVPQRLIGHVVGSDIMFGFTVFLGLRMMLMGGVVVAGGHGMMPDFGKIDRSCNRRLLTGGSSEIARQWACIMCRIIRTRRLPTLPGADRMAMSGLRLMRGMGVVLADLIVPRRLAMKPRRLLVMAGRRRVVRGWILRMVHDVISFMIFFGAAIAVDRSRRSYIVMDRLLRAMTAALRAGDPFRYQTITANGGARQDRILLRPA